MHTGCVARDPLVQTRLKQEIIDRLATVALRNERTVAAELRVAISKHLADEEGRRWP